jgi:hypothetical protein
VREPYGLAFRLPRQRAETNDIVQAPDPPDFVAHVRYRLLPARQRSARSAGRASRDKGAFGLGNGGHRCPWVLLRAP